MNDNFINVLFNTHECIAEFDDQCEIERLCKQYPNFTVMCSRGTEFKYQFYVPICLNKCESHCK